MMQDRAIRDRVLEVLKQIAPEADLPGIDPAASFRDQFDIDSIDFLNFVVGLEEAFDVRIDDATYPRFSSLDGCVAYLAEAIGRPASPVGEGLLP